MALELDEDWDLKCPTCGQNERFRISCRSMFTMTSEGSEDYEDVEYDAESHAACTSCAWEGKVRELQHDAK